MVYVESIDIVSLGHIYKAVSGPVDKSWTAGAQPDAPLLVSGVQRFLVYVDHCIFRVDISTITPESYVSPDFYSKRSTSFDHAKQRRVVETTHRTADCGVYSLSGPGVQLLPGSPVFERTGLYNLGRGSESGGVTYEAFRHYGRQPDFVTEFV
jgi:hypothetical protein